MPGPAGAKKSCPNTRPAAEAYRKKSYHSTVVPTTVAKTTRRRSVDVEMVPVGVKPGEEGRDMGLLRDVVVGPPVSPSTPTERVAGAFLDHIRFRIRRKGAS